MLPVDMLGQEIKVGNIIAYASGSTRADLKIGYVIKIESENKSYLQRPVYDYKTGQYTHTDNIVQYWKHRIYQTRLVFERKHWSDKEKSWYLTAPRWVPVQEDKIVVLHCWDIDSNIPKLIEMAQAKYGI